MMLLPLALVAAVAVASPAPSPTPLRVIVTVKTTNFCSAVSSTALPIAFVDKKNNEAFSAINHGMLKFWEDNTGVVPVTSPAEVAELETALDDPETYGPQNTMNVTQMQRIVYDIDQNLVTEDNLMKKSRQDHPNGADPDVDAMRQRLQNLIDLQRALANQYQRFAGMYLDNQGVAPPDADPGAFKALLRQEIYGQAAASIAVKGVNDPEILPHNSVHDIAHAGGPLEIVKELRLQEYAFAKEMIPILEVCNL